ncbi:MAG: hypothetical protein J0I06_16300, partial [Planctomycetes bacterium]|nr:hypothetical protein [Planctomycetota bacterium]
MAQGTRGRWVRAAATGFGVVLCTGLVGCMNSDKPKDTKATRQPGPGLPGTPMLQPGAGAGAAANRTPQPGLGQPYNGPGGNIQPTGGFGTTGTSGSFRTGSTGVNPLTTSVPQPNFSAPPGAPGTIGAPAQPGMYPSMQPSVLPVWGAGGPLGAAPAANAGSVASA